MIIGAYKHETEPLFHLVKLSKDFLPCKLMVKHNKELYGIYKSIPDKDGVYHPDIEAIATEENIERVRLIKAKASELILSRYPLWLQLNLVTDNDADKLNTYIKYKNDIRDFSNKMEVENIPYEDIDWSEFK